MPGRTFRSGHPQQMTVKRPARVVQHGRRVRLPDDLMNEIGLYCALDQGLEPGSAAWKKCVAYWVQQAVQTYEHGGTVTYRPRRVVPTAPEPAVVYEIDYKVRAEGTTTEAKPMPLAGGGAQQRADQAAREAPPPPAASVDEAEAARAARAARSDRPLVPPGFYDED